jgi:hypothetical protein
LRDSEFEDKELLGEIGTFTIGVGMGTGTGSDLELHHIIML